MMTSVVANINAARPAAAAEPTCSRPQNVVMPVAVQSRAATTRRGTSLRAAPMSRGAGMRATTPQAGNGTTAPAMAQMAEYIWSDGHEGDESKMLMFNEMRSKTKCIQNPVAVGGKFPDWSYDGSSTNQAQGGDSDCILRPCFSCIDPIRGGHHVLVLCEVMMPDGVTPHPTNHRHKLQKLIEQNAALVEKEDPWYGFEQEYTMMAKGGQKVYGWPDDGAFPAPQGHFYCATGLEGVYGRPLVEAHLEMCLRAGLQLSGVNAEVMPGQWEYQVGPVGPMSMGDETMVARWLLARLGEDFGASITLAPKPVKGDWNGTGAHTNFSTVSMRQPGGRAVIDEAIVRLEKNHMKHIVQYGKDNDQRLTGKHETCDLNTFRAGVADRGASIRIPRLVEQEGYGYLEDRRPGANVDPYVVARLLLATCLDLDDESATTVARETAAAA